MFNKFSSIFRREPCYLCCRLGYIAIVNIKRAKNLNGKKELCPACKGKGYLRIHKGDYEQ